MGIETVLLSLAGAAVSSALAPKAPKAPSAAALAAERAQSDNLARAAANARVSSARNRSRSTLGGSTNGGGSGSTSILSYGKPNLGG